MVIRGDNARFDTIAPALLPFVTQWGRDPIWDSGTPSAQSRVSDFPAAVANETVALLEQPGTLVQVVGHRVHFDAVRKLWYCDIELNPGTTYMPFVRLALVRYQPNALAEAKVSKVVLAEFAQVLPRRRAVLQRQASSLTLKLHGPVPDRGPMRQFNPGGTPESPYADISFQPGLGQNFETGRNRVELVLQTRDPAIDSDLAWTDQAVVGTGSVGGEGAPANPAPPVVELPRPVIVLPVDHLQRVPIRTRLGSTLRFDRMERRADAIGGAAAVTAAAVTSPSDRLVEPLTNFPWLLIDPPVWTLTAPLPALPTDRPARLMLREFERYYTDRTVPETRAGATRRRIVVEERLVYAEVFGLD